MILSAHDIIESLDLAPHPEGGYYRRTFDNATGPADRGKMSAIYYLLEQQGFALWHKFDADEIWFWNAGAPLTIEVGREKAAQQIFELGPELGSGQRPQAIIPANHWQRARTNGAWTLVSCAVSPGFLFETLDLHMESRPD
ncbi:MAG: cupin domain-containing protein [Alphaproteobacteria bacterium]|nr:cupin domain-containing protein [Alphaproteobacteria bacterium]